MKIKNSLSSYSLRPLHETKSHFHSPTPLKQENQELKTSLAKLEAKSIL